MGFQGQMAINCNTKVLDRVRQGNKCTTYSYKVCEGKRERALDFRPEDTIIASVLSFSLSLFNVINTFLHRQEEVRDLMRGCRLLELRCRQRMSDEGRSAFQLQ